MARNLAITEEDIVLIKSALNARMRVVLELKSGIDYQSLGRLQALLMRLDNAVSGESARPLKSVGMVDGHA